MITDEQLDAWQALADSASPGEWEVQQSDWADGHGFWWQITCPERNDETVVELQDCVIPPVAYQPNCYGEIPPAENLVNAHLIAVSREAIPALIAEVRRLRSVCGEAYQLAGVVAHLECTENPEIAMDNLSAAAAGDPLPHESFLPVRLRAAAPRYTSEPFVLPTEGE